MTFRTRTAVMAAAVVVLVSWLSFQPGGTGLARVASNLSLMGGSLLATWACFQRARRSQSSRRAWFLTGLSALLWGAATASCFSELVLGDALPYPSFADALYLGSAAVGLAALFAFPSAPRGLADRARMFLDGLIIAASLVFIVWDAVLEPLIHSSTPNLPSYRWLALAYPLTGIARSSILLVIVARAKRGRGALNLLTGGVVALALSDAVYAYLINQGTYQTGGPVDAGAVLVAYFLIALAAFSPVGEDEPRTGTTSMVVPYLPMVVVAAILWVALTVEHLHGALLWTGMVVFALVAVRQALTHLENRSLTGSLETRICAAEASEAELRRRGRQVAEAQHLARLGSWEMAIGSPLIDVSAGLYEIFRVEPGVFEPTPTNFLDLLHPHDRAGLRAVMNAGATGAAGSADFRIRIEDGRSAWLHATVEPVRAAGGAIVGLRGTAQDISARRASEQALRVSEERLRNVIDHSPLAIIEFDTTKTVRVWNPAAEAMYKWTREEVEGRLAPFAQADDVEGVFDKLFRRALAGEVVHNVEVVRRRKDEETLNVSVSMAPIRDAGGDIIGVTSAGLDISHQRRLEDELRQAQKMEAIGRLAGGIAHDFNNILTVVVGYGEMLLDELEPQSPVGKRVRFMYDAAGRAAELTDQLLTFSRRHVVTGQPADFNAAVASMRPMVKRLIGDDIDLRIQLCDEELCVAADRQQVQQLLLNLVVNARDAMPGGGALTITTTSAAATSGPATAVLQVADTGSGMDESTRDRIFEPFFTTKPEQAGTGLGLSTVYGIVRQHGGDVDVASVPGAGSVFTISMPLLASASAMAGADDGGVTARVGTVLLVEDEATVRFLAREILELRGHEVIEAADGVEALAAAATHPGRIDVLVIDVVLPRMPGPVVAERLMVGLPELQIVFMSGYAEEHLAGVDFGKAQFLAKPFRPADLAGAVEMALAATSPQGSGSKR